MLLYALKNVFCVFPTKQIVHIFTPFEQKTLKKNLQILTNPESSHKLFTFLK